MKYMLVNVGPGAVQIDLHHPEPSYNKKNLHRPGPVIAINIPRGQAKDILPFFNGSLEEAHKCVKYSKDTLRHIRPTLIHAYVCDDDMKPLDIDALLGGTVAPAKVSVKAPEKDPDTTRPSLEPAIMAAEERKLIREEPPADDQGPGEEEESEEVEPDDLTVLKGVGKSMQHKLNEAGYMTYASVAEADLEELKKIVGKHAEDAQESAKEMLVAGDTEIIE